MLAVESCTGAMKASVSQERAWFVSSCACTGGMNDSCCHRKGFACQQWSRALESCLEEQKHRRWFLNSH